MKPILIKYFVKDVERDDETCYFDHYKNFKHYDIENPVTKVLGQARLKGNVLKNGIRKCVLKIIKEKIRHNIEEQKRLLENEGRILS